MNKEEYKVEGNKATAKRLNYVWSFIVAWPFLLLFCQYAFVDCSLEASSCSTEQIYTIFYIQTFAPLPFVILVSYIGYYSLKVLKQKQIPPKGLTFPYTIPRVTYRDHYTFGITGVILSVLVIYAFVDSVYLTYNITSI